MRMTQTTKVTMGMPVYNGAAYVAAAIEAVRRQTFTDFCLHIYDNASTDGTGEICSHYASVDRRVSYVRNALNIGAAANFNRSFGRSMSPYFKWVSHDDLIAPEFLERCVSVLDAAPDVCLCHCVVEHIDEYGATLGYYDPGIHGTDKVRSSERFAGRLQTAWCKEVFGLIRTEVLRDSVMMDAYVGSDQALLAELALRGRFVVLREPLFKNRDHVGRSTYIPNYSRERRAWYSAAAPRTRHEFPQWTLLLKILWLIKKWEPSRRERVCCYLHILSHLVCRGRLVLLLLEPVFSLRPELFPRFERLLSAIGLARNRHRRLRKEGDQMTP